MDFNEIQNTWNSDNASGGMVPANLAKIKSANTPLDKIRKNLKKEFIFQMISIIFIGFVPVLYRFPQKTVMPFYLLYSFFVAVSIYYLVKLFLFYKRLPTVTLTTKDSLYETYFDVRLNMELYKTFGFALTPFIVLFLVGVFYFQYSERPGFQLADVTNNMWISMFVIVAVSILFMGLALEWWVRRFYGKYAKEIKNVLDELKEE